MLTLILILTIIMNVIADGTRISAFKDKENVYLGGL